MKNIVAFAGSNSSTSINHQLLSYVKRTLEEKELKIDLIRLTDFNIPLYSMDIETNDGIPGGVEALFEKIQTADGIVISVAEHNGNVTAFFKSITDWLSRHNRHFLEGKKVLLLSTSPGKGAAASALAVTAKALPYFKAEIIVSQSVSGFYDILKDGDIIDTEIKTNLAASIHSFVASI